MILDRATILRCVLIILTRLRRLSPNEQDSINALLKCIRVIHNSMVYPSLYTWSVENVAELRDEVFIPLRHYLCQLMDTFRQATVERGELNILYPLLTDILSYDGDRFSIEHFSKKNDVPQVYRLLRTVYSCYYYNDVMLLGEVYI